MELKQVMQLIGGLGVFLYGMKLMSESLQRAAGGNLQILLNRMTTNRFTAVLSGAAITTAVQSSSATTVMVVGFVNAGLLKLRQAIGVIMGANIGTTFTAWMVAYLGFKFKISTYALPAIAVGVILLFTNRDNLVSWGSTIIGFGLLFLGLHFLKKAVPDLKSNPESLVFLQEFAKHGYLSVIIFVGIGTLLTVVVQSSSATSAITITLAVKGYISSDLALAMILGENIGTTITANLAALAGNIHAKKAALAHSVFNLIGVVWALLLFPWLTKLVPLVVSWFQSAESLQDKTSLAFNVSVFHTGFNVMNTLLLVWFIPVIAGIVNGFVDTLVRLKGGKEPRALKLLNFGSVRATDLSLLEATAYNRESTLSALDNFSKVQELINRKNVAANSDELFRIEAELDEHRSSMLAYLTEVQTSGVAGEQAVSLLNTIERVRLLEHLGDSFARVARKVRRAEKGDVTVPKKMKFLVNDAMTGLHEHFDLLRLALEGSGRTSTATADISRTLRAQSKKLLRRIERKAQKKRTGGGKKDALGVLLATDLMLILDGVSRTVHEMIVIGE